MVVENLDLILRLIIAAILGGAIGYEREKRGKTAGLRTHTLVCIGSALITVVGIYGFSVVGADTSRLAAGIVTGIGFLGAGAIIASGKEVHGLTTAASIWVVSAIGIAAGTGMYLIAIITTIIAFGVLQLWRIEFPREKKKNE